MVEITKSYIPAGTPARPGYPMDPTGVTIHNTGSSASAKNHMLYMTQNGGFNSTTSYHFVIDDVDCYQLLPITENAWHAGDGALGAGNRKTIAIEICECGDIRKAHDRAAQLAAYLLKEIGGTPQKNLYQHADFMNKDCPRLLRSGRPYTWEVFAEKVKQAMEKNSNPAPATKPKPKPKIEDKARAVHRLYNPNSGDHLYTTSYAEAKAQQNAGMEYEGIAWIYPETGAGIFRLVSGGKHHLALKDEHDKLVKLGWKSEGMIARSGGEGRPIRRLYNPNGGEHIFTTSDKEHNALAAAGWKCELAPFTY